MESVPLDPFYRRPAAILSHDPNPAWGLPSSAVDWCEANYVHTGYVAELFNTLSAVPMPLVSIWGLWLCHTYKMGRRFLLCWLGIGAVGVGTVLFHGALHPSGQAADELAMVAASLAFLYVALEVDYLEPRRAWLPAIEALYGAGFAVAYFASPFFFPFFIAAYGATVLLIIHQSYRVYVAYSKGDCRAAKWQRWLFRLGAGGYPGAFLFLWLPENALCPLYPGLFQALNLHAWFHIVTTASPYCFLVFMTFHRCRVLGRRAEHRFGMGFPYIHVLEYAP